MQKLYKNMNSSPLTYSGLVVSLVLFSFWKCFFRFYDFYDRSRFFFIFSFYICINVWRQGEVEKNTSGWFAVLCNVFNINTLFMQYRNFERGFNVNKEHLSKAFSNCITSKCLNMFEWIVVKVEGVI